MWLVGHLKELAVSNALIFSGSSKVLIQTATLKDFRHNVSNLSGLPQLCTRWKKQCTEKCFWSNLYGAEFLTIASIGFDVPAQLWSPHSSTQHGPWRGRCSHMIHTIAPIAMTFSLRWFIGHLGLCSTGPASSHFGEMLLPNMPNSYPEYFLATSVLQAQRSTMQCGAV